MLRNIQEPGTERHRVIVVVRMSKVMVRMIYCGNKDVSQMGGAIVVCVWGKGYRERESGYVVSCVCVCVQCAGVYEWRLTFFTLGWSISGPFLTSEVSVILKNTCGIAWVPHMENTYPVGFD